MKKEDLKVHDHFKSKEIFKLKWNESYACYETFPKPSVNEIYTYYESEDYISHQKEYETIKDLVYNWVRSYMLNAKIKWIKKETETKGDLLDFGCGVGEFITVANKSGFKAIGIEPNEKARNIANNAGLKVHKDLEDLNDKKFNVVSLWHVLEHLYDPNEFLKEIKNKLLPEGKLFIAVPNFKSYDAKYYKEYWAAYDVPRHLFHFSRDSINVLAKKNGYKIKKVYPLKFDSFYVSMLSEKYKTGSQNINWIWQGLKSNLKANKDGEWSSLVYVLEKE